MISVILRPSFSGNWVAVITYPDQGPYTPKIYRMGADRADLIESLILNPPREVFQ